MSETSIQWTDHSVNPIRARLKDGSSEVGHYCEKVSPGCTNCYSSAFQKRRHMPPFGSGQRLESVEVVFDESKLQEVLRRKKPTKYFWCDMTDLFGSWVPDAWIDRCFAVMALTPQHTHQVLTKRADRMAGYTSSLSEGNYRRIRHAMLDMQDGQPSPIFRAISRIEDSMQHRDVGYLDNIWLGVSVEDQARADERIPLLLQCPAAVRFLSCEPLLGPLDLSPWFEFGEKGPPWLCDRRDDDGSVIDQAWVIIGGESGPKARPCHVEWIHLLVNQCRSAGVPCFVKQLGASPQMTWGEFCDWKQNPPAVDCNPETIETIRFNDPKGGDPSEWSEDLRVREFPRC